MSNKVLTASTAGWAQHVVRAAETASSHTTCTDRPHFFSLSRSTCLRIGHKRRCLSTQISTGQTSQPAVPPPNGTKGVAAQNKLGRTARQKQADKEFFADLLSSAATKRDANAYLTRLKSPKKLVAQEPGKPIQPNTSKSAFAKPQVNVGNLFGRARAVDQSPIFTQYNEEHSQHAEEVETLHVALVKVVDVGNLSEETIQGVAQTLSQLSRLSMAPCVVLEPNISGGAAWREKIVEQADRLVAAIEAVHEPGAIRLDNLLSVEEARSPEVFLRKLLLRPLRGGRIPVVLPLAYSTSMQSALPVAADEVVLALTRELAGLHFKPPSDQDPIHTADFFRSLQKQVSLDRIIILDDTGAIPSSASEDNTHVFVNLEQEYTPLQDELATIQNQEIASRHKANLKLMKDALHYLPNSSSGLITSPAEAANPSRAEQDSSSVSGVGTRRQKNALIHNLLTDKPAYSSSLPAGRLGQKSALFPPRVLSTSTFVKRGMPLTILPDPASNPWVADNHGKPRLKLTDPRIDLPRLTHLIDDSFNRKLDVEAYLNRVNDRIAGVIIAGEYEGGALLTWETPPGAEDGDDARLVPYLDKFAVLKRSQGAGGVADILFNAMVRTCFPHGVCWRSRKDNPVNKWYFERSRGTWKIPDTNWTMFWTTPGVVQHGGTFLDYEGVCRGVMPTWADNQKVVD